MFDDFVRLPLTIFITRSTNKVWKYKKEYKTIDRYTFHPKKDALLFLQEFPHIMLSYISQALMKQKHRLMWERRHGEVGTGMKAESTPAAEE